MLSEADGTYPELLLALIIQVHPTMSRLPSDTKLPAKFAHAEAPLQPIIDRSCTHGGPPPRDTTTVTVRCPLIFACVSSIEHQDRQVLVRHGSDDTALEDLHSERFTAKLWRLETFWSHFDHSRHIDETMTSLCFSLATDATLDGNYAAGRSFFLIGLFLREWNRLGGTAFCQALHAIDDDTSLRRLTNAMKKTATDQGMILYLATHIPCSCLDVKAQQAAALPKMAKCHYCGKQDEANKIQKCSGCKQAEYCSRKCQVADWKAGHKKYCKQIVEQEKGR